MYALKGPVYTGMSYWSTLGPALQQNIGNNVLKPVLPVSWTARQFVIFIYWCSGTSFRWN